MATTMNSNSNPGGLVSTSEACRVLNGILQNTIKSHTQLIVQQRQDPTNVQLKAEIRLTGEKIKLISVELKKCVEERRRNESRDEFDRGDSASLSSSSISDDRDSYSSGISSSGHHHHRQQSSQRQTRSSNPPPMMMGTLMRNQVHHSTSQNSGKQERSVTPIKSPSKPSSGSGGGFKAPLKQLDKDSYLRQLGLLDHATLAEFQNKKSERKRRSTANPQFSNAAMEIKAAAKRARRRDHSGGGRSVPFGNNNSSNLSHYRHSDSVTNNNGFHLGSPTKSSSSSHHHHSYHHQNSLSSSPVKSQLGGGGLSFSSSPSISPSKKSIKSSSSTKDHGGSYMSSASGGISAGLSSTSNPTNNKSSPSKSSNSNHHQMSSSKDTELDKETKEAMAAHNKILRTGTLKEQLLSERELLRKKKSRLEKKIETAKGQQHKLSERYNDIQANVNALSNLMRYLKQFREPHIRGGGGGGGSSAASSSFAMSSDRDTSSSAVHGLISPTLRSSTNLQTSLQTSPTSLISSHVVTSPTGGPTTTMLTNFSPQFSLSSPGGKPMGTTTITMSTIGVVPTMSTGQANQSHGVPHHHHQATSHPIIIPIFSGMSMANCSNGQKLNSPGGLQHANISTLTMPITVSSPAMAAQVTAAGQQQQQSILSPAPTLHMAASPNQPKFLISSPSTTSNAAGGPQVAPPPPSLTSIATLGIPHLGAKGSTTGLVMVDPNTHQIISPLTLPPPLLQQQPLQSAVCGQPQPIMAAAAPIFRQELPQSSISSGGAEIGPTQESNTNDDQHLLDDEEEEKNELNDQQEYDMAGREQNEEVAEAEADDQEGEIPRSPSSSSSCPPPLTISTSSQEPIATV